MLIFKYCAPFTNCISRINNIQVDDASYIDVVMALYNLIEYTDNYLKTSEILWQLYKDVDDVGITDFTANVTESFNLKVKLKSQTGNNVTKNDKVPLKCLSNFWRTVEIPLINCEITLYLSWSENWVIVATNAANQGTTFSITDTKLYVPVITLSMQDNAKLLEKLKPGFKRTIKWDKYQPKVLTEIPNHYLDFLVDPRFQVVNRLFVLSFEDEAQKISNKRY